jgi:predicted nucleotidyltransferase
LFGSYARGDTTEDSDIDILIRLQETCSLFQLVKIENDLSELIDRKVDLVTEGAIKNERISKSIQQDLQVIISDLLIPSLWISALNFRNRLL